MTSNNRGFTLIELVVVIVILGILAAVALPKYINLQQDAQVATLESLNGELNSAVARINATSRLDGRIETEVTKDGTRHYVRADAQTRYKVSLVGDNAYLDGSELCHAIGLMDGPVSGNPKPGNSLDGNFSCKDENSEFAWIRINELSRDQCYIRYNKKTYRSALHCDDASACVCP